MRITIRLIWGILAGLVFFAGQAMGADRLSDYNLLRNVTTDLEGEEVLIRLEFKKTLGQYQEPVFYRKSIQIDFPFAYIDPSKRYFATGDETVRRVYVSQFKGCRYI